MSYNSIHVVSGTSRNGGMYPSFEGVDIYPIFDDKTLGYARKSFSRGRRGVAGATMLFELDRWMEEKAVESLFKDARIISNTKGLNIPTSNNRDPLSDHHKKEIFTVGDKKVLDEFDKTLTHNKDKEKFKVDKPVNNFYNYEKKRRKETIVRKTIHPGADFLDKMTTMFKDPQFKEKLNKPRPRPPECVPNPARGTMAIDDDDDWSYYEQTQTEPAF